MEKNEPRNPAPDPVTRRSDQRPHLLCITRPDLGPTNRILEAACAAREVDFVPVIAGRLSEGGLDARHGTRLLYRADTDTASVYLEKLLFSAEVAAFHDPHFPCGHPPITLQRAGIPVARKIFLSALNPADLADQVEWLGGYPVVVKLPGTEGGRGVLLQEHQEGLEGTLRRAPPGVYLETFVPHEKAYRLLVVGQSVVAVTAATPGAGDFRSNSATARDLGPVTPPGNALEIARRATAALRLEFGGVGLLESDDGGIIVSEVNCPCYFADQQQATGHDLAGAMIDHLLSKRAPVSRVR